MQHSWYLHKHAIVLMPSSIFIIKPTTASHPTLNVAIFIECTKIHHMVSSAAEAEVGALFHNTKASLPLRQLVSAIGSPRPPTSITTDDTTEKSFTCDNINLKRSKS